MDLDIQNQPLDPTPKKRYKGWKLKRRWPMAVLGGIVLPLTIFMGVFEMYAGNYEEFRFSLVDFAPYLILCCLGAAAVLCGVLLALRGRVFDVALAVVLSVSLMACIQNMFLNIGIDSLSGDGLGMTINPVWKIVNLCIWLLVIAGGIVTFLLVKKRKYLRLGATVVLVVLIGMQIPSFISLSVTTDVYKPKDQTIEVEQDTSLETSADAESEEKQPQVLTTKNLYTVGSEKNVVVFLVDRFDARYVEEILADNPHYFDDWYDFVYYEDNITTYSRTYPAVGSILSGKLNPFGKGDTAAEYFEDAYQNSPLFEALKADDFSINVYTDDYYAYRDAAEFKGIADNISGVKCYTVQNQFNLCLDLLKLSAYRYSPVALKPVFNVSTDSFEKYVVYETEYPMYELRDEEIFAGLEENGLTVGQSRNNFAFIHLWGIHPPYRIDADGGKSTTQSSLGATLGCLELVKAYVSELKSLGLYEDATIVITGDHPDPISDDVLPEIPRLTALFVKRAGESGQPFKTSSAQVGQADLIPSLLASANVPYDSDLGRCYWDIPEGENRTRYYHFAVNPTLTRGEYWFAKFIITGDGRDFDNWEVEDEYSMNGFYYR